MSCDHNTSVTMAAGLAKDSYANSYSGPKKKKKKTTSLNNREFHLTEHTPSGPLVYTKPSLKCRHTHQSENTHAVT